jgi:UDP-N-acetylglucosamine/UDP-N-acetylgalactosamine 4-epimerase
LDPLKDVERRLAGRPRRWLVTGVAGFIGSNLLQTLLETDQLVTGLDDLSTGKRSNLDEVRRLVGEERYRRFRFIEGDVSSPETCRDAVTGVDAVLHQAALGSVPRSIEEPLLSNRANVTGHLALLEEARQAGVRRFVYASSSAVYGDSPKMPKFEDETGDPISPYAVTKVANELYATCYGHLHGMETLGLRYFNVFGPRQDPDGAYAAVIPKWIASMLRGETVRINGSGETSRDFCFVRNVVQANLLAATTDRAEALNQAYNVAVGARSTLLELFEALRSRLGKSHPRIATMKPEHGPFRTGDVLHSLADIGKARRLLGYEPTHTMEQGLDEALDWYEKSLT